MEMQEEAAFDGADRCLGLADMPPEIVVHILAWANLRDRAACAIASSLLAVEPLAGIAARCSNLSLPAALAAGAPLDVIVVIVTWRCAVVRPMLLKWAVRGGRLDVVDWIYAHIKGKIRVRCKDDDDDSEDEKDYCEHDCDEGISSATTADENKPFVLHPRPDWHPARVKRHRKRHRAHRIRKRYTGPTIVALYEAAYRGHAAMLSSLLDRWRIDFQGKYGQRLLYALMIEACTGPTPGTDTIELLHRHKTRFSKDGSCGCWKDAGYAAASAERIDVLAWMHNVGCDARLDTRWHELIDHSKTPLYKAMCKGRAITARWLAGVMKVASWPERDKHLANPMETAAARGHVKILEVFHGLGAQVCLPGAIVAGAMHGHLDILEWALANTLPLPDSPDTRAVSVCPPLSIGWAAAVSDNQHIVRWLLQRPDARRFLGVGAARAALAKGHVGIALCLHEAGVAPFDQWNALITAVASGKPKAVEAALGCGAVRDIGALAKAIHEGGRHILAVLCKHYEATDIQTAVDTVAGLPASGWVNPRRHSLEWLVDNVPGLCIANIVGCSCVFKLECRCDKCLLGAQQ
ncbi:Ankyrin repeat domain containing protein [Pandoravirus salinus]|uniref:Ankyrin repeat domain containing protein n=1 Tax=Pandoravirus salinus TaxID=1349410 RepID=S4W032_9VIRU|nr:ankyrin repeat domain [Pandoravirus salinus]AGO85136.1 Ankyrin repeat domain containing protein [Pandoravirus salinus]